MVVFSYSATIDLRARIRHWLAQRVPKKTSSSMTMRRWQMDTLFCTLTFRPMTTPGLTTTSSAQITASPICALAMTWLKCQTLLLFPTLASGSDQRGRICIVLYCTFSQHLLRLACVALMLKALLGSFEYLQNPQTFRTIGPRSLPSCTALNEVQTLLAKWLLL